MEQVDVCAMFADEVDALPTPDAIAVVQAGGDIGDPENLEAPTLAGFYLDYEGAGDDRHRFTAMWYERGKEPKTPERVCRPRSDYLRRDRHGLSALRR